jgi:Cu(I)/Ag(I) efflux system membrane protein CusA/SilA
MWQFPSIANAWTMPVRACIDMLSTGIHAPSASKPIKPISARWRSLKELIEAVLRNVSGASSAHAEHEIDGYYLDIILDRVALGR